MAMDCQRCLPPTNYFESCPGDPNCDAIQRDRVQGRMSGAEDAVLYAGSIIPAFYKIAILT